MRNFSDYQQLVAYLDTSGCPNIMNIYQVDGYLRALAITTAVLAPKWYNLIFGDENNLLGEAELQAPLEEIQRLFDWHRQEVNQAAMSFPFSGAYTHQQWMIEEAAAWARGFIQGYIVQEPYWECYLSRVSECELDRFDDDMKLLCVIADAHFARDQGAAPADFAGALAGFSGAIKRWGK